MVDIKEEVEVITNTVETYYEFKINETSTYLKVVICHPGKTISYSLKPYNGYDKFEIKNTSSELLNDLSDIFKRVAGIIDATNKQNPGYKLEGN